MSIIDKLNLTKYNHLVVLNQPEDNDVFDAYPTELTGAHDAIFIFVQTLDEMIRYTRYIIDGQHLAENGYLFFAYPKKGNKRYGTYVHRDEILPAMGADEDGYVGNSDLKFARMVGMDEVFTVIGIKREKRKAAKTSAVSLRVGDYADQVKDVEELLASYPKVQELYRELTPGYQRDWARYLFSAKQSATREKRLEQMVDVLSQGYKTMDLYRQKK